jgi:hypothetical protein
MRGRRPKPTRLKSSPAIPAGVRSTSTNRGPKPSSQTAQSNSARSHGENGTGWWRNSPRAALASYCGAYGMWAEATEAI